MHNRVLDQNGGRGGIPNDHTRSQGGMGGVQEGPKTDPEILEQPLIVNMNTGPGNGYCEGGENENEEVDK